jgi:2-dehydro-3-deoxyglucarate aldolase
VLDAGAHGVIVPMVSTAAQAKAAVGAVRYPPVGVRGVGLSRAQGYGAGFERYLRDIEPNTILIAQIEHADAISNLDEILSIDEIDATIIGPYDLSGSVGKPGKFDDPEVQELLKRYKEVSRRKGKGMGYHVVQPDAGQVRERLAEGYILLALSVDFLFLANGCRTALSELRNNQ